VVAEHSTGVQRKLPRGALSGWFWRAFITDSFILFAQTLGYFFGIYPDGTGRPGMPTCHAYF